jgi:hypothetical protein
MFCDNPASFTHFIVFSVYNEIETQTEHVESPEIIDLRQEIVELEKSLMISRGEAECLQKKSDFLERKCQEREGIIQELQVSECKCQIISFFDFFSLYS